jgi:hypothetical protein
MKICEPVKNSEGENVRRIGVSSPDKCARRQLHITVGCECQGRSNVSRLQLIKIVENLLFGHAGGYRNPKAANALLTSALVRFQGDSIAIVHWSGPSQQFINLSFSLPPLFQGLTSSHCYLPTFIIPYRRVGQSVRIRFPASSTTATPVNDAPSALRAAIWSWSTVAPVRSAPVRVARYRLACVRLALVRSAPVRSA